MVGDHNITTCSFGDHATVQDCYFYSDGTHTCDFREVKYNEYRSKPMSNEDLLDQKLRLCAVEKPPYPKEVCDDLKQNEEKHRRAALLKDEDEGKGNAHYFDLCQKKVFRDDYCANLCNKAKTVKYAEMCDGLRAKVADKAKRAEAEAKEPKKEDAPANK